jgi:hypothetical protein
VKKKLPLQNSINQYSSFSEIAALFKKYQLDFELYGYSPEPFFDIASQ